MAMASAGALVGLAAFGHTNSDAFKIIPIAGTFLRGVLGYSRNDALYEAYEVAGIKNDQVLRAAEDKQDSKRFKVSEEQQIARAILRYLDANPEAQDTVEGIAQW